MTVSRVLNDRPAVSAETRQRVQQIFDDPGCRPSAVIRIHFEPGIRRRLVTA